MGDAAMGKAVFNPTADWIADLTDGAGGGVEVGELGAKNRQAERQRVGGAEDEGGSGCGDSGVGEGHHKREVDCQIVPFPQVARITNNQYKSTPYNQLRKAIAPDEFHQRAKYFVEEAVSFASITYLILRRALSRVRKKISNNLHDFHID
jgi:hypothetical protein